MVDNIILTIIIAAITAMAIVIVVVAQKILKYVLEKYCSFFLDLMISLIIFYAIYSFAIAIVEHEEIKEAKGISSSTRN